MLEDRKKIFKSNIKSKFIRWDIFQNKSKR